MSAEAGILGRSNRYLSELLLRFWVGSSLLIASTLMLWNLLQRQQDLIQDAEQFVTLVRSSLLADLPQSRLDSLLDQALYSLQEERLDGLNLLLLVDQRGKIIYSSRPSGRHLRIDDPWVNLSVTQDQDVQRVLRCFRNQRRDCLAIRSHDAGFHPSSFSVIRPLDGPEIGRAHV